MTTYNTYQEAKIAHPKSLILVRDGSFDAMENIASSQLDKWGEVNPADHCMTVKDFLSSGYEFVKGDIYMFSDGFVNTVKTPENKPAMGDSSRYILHASMLEARKEIAGVMIEKIQSAFSEMSKPKPRTKVEYVEYEPTFGDMVYLARNNKTIKMSDVSYLFIGVSLDDKGVFQHPASKNIFEEDMSLVRQRNERPIEWWEDAADYLSSIDGCVSNLNDGKLLISGQYTHEQMLDFARILLEQEGE